VPDSTPLFKSAAFAALPPVWPSDVLAVNAAAATASGRTLVVLDDDPTGTQTVRDIAVVTTWDVATLTAELAAAPACFYILTNSRSLTAPASRALHLELAANLRAAGLANFRIDLLDESPDESLHILNAYSHLLSGLADGSSLWRDLKALSQLGVTSGTLRDSPES
jgi:hypothetical protein